MKFLLFGRNGQVGWELQRSLSVLGEVVALDFDTANNPNGLCGDFCNPSGLAAAVQTVRPDVIVNAAAHTAVDKAESEPELARTINASAPAVLAKEAQALGAWLVHYSTDYVFDGSGNRAWIETDATGPLSVYGQTKLEGERAVSECSNHLIFRTSWVYAARGGNFAKTMLRLASERDTLSVIDDQHGAPTSAELLADVTAHAVRVALLNQRVAGLYHCAAAGETTWHGYASFALSQAQALGKTLKVKPEEINAIASANYPTPARRPLNSRLNCNRLESVFSLKLPAWDTGVKRMLTEITEKS